MDLFPVARYLGDEENPKNEEEHLNKLLTKIKQRSKLKKEKLSKEFNLQNGTLNSICEPDQSEKVDEVKSEKKRKKKNVFNSSSTNSKPEETSNFLVDELNRLKVDSAGDENISVENKTSREIQENHDNEQEEEEEEVDGVENEVFPVIGDFKFKKKHKVKRVLPDWLTNPSIVSVDLKNLDVCIDDIPELHPTFVKTLQKNNISYFFPVQAQVIPWLLNCTKTSSFFWPSDVCVSAPTGSGKTLAYVLPILQALMGHRTGHIQALVVLPVQDLAAQVASVFRTYSAHTNIKVHLSTGSLPLTDDRAHLLHERRGVGWESLVDVLVITPGRLVEHLYTTPGFSLEHLQYIVIDEADRIVDNMQNNWLHHLDRHLNVQGCPLLTLHNLRTLPRRPQKLLFSATLSIDPEKLNQLNLFQPRLFTSVVEASRDKGGESEFIGKFTTPAELSEHMVRCNLVVKPLVLYHLVTSRKWSGVLVFTSSSRSVHQLYSLLLALANKNKRVLNVKEISAECSPKKRESVLNDFAAGKVDVLVSTDALARGMDIPNVQYVISYDMPKYVKAYIHRIGRTGRAGQPGVALTLVQHTQVGLFQQMLQTAGKQDSITELSVSDEELKALEMSFKEALAELKNVTKIEDKEKLQKTKSLKRISSTKMLHKKRKKKRMEIKNK